MQAVTSGVDTTGGPVMSVSTTYARNERAFPVLPRTHPKSIRRREVIKYKSYRDMNTKQEWNPSTQDLLHPFPERAFTHTNSSYNGVDVVTTHFPDTVKGTASLRVHGGGVKPSVWTTNVNKSLSSHKNMYQCAALKDPEPALSYLARKIIEDNTPEKRRLEQVWHASTALSGRWANPHVAASPEPDYVTMNTKKLGVHNHLIYKSPQQRVKDTNAGMRATRRLEREARSETPLALHSRSDAPAVFKMSNIDAWWTLNPTTVAQEQMELKESMTANPFMTYKMTVSDVVPATEVRVPANESKHTARSHHSTSPSIQGPTFDSE